MTEPLRAKTIALGLLGAAIGGTAGYLVFFWMAGQGYYALILPPSLMGYTAGAFARSRSLPLAITCATAGLALALFIEWRFAPFVADSSLSYFLTHLQDLRPISLLMLALGSFFAFRFALGQDSPTSRG